MLMYELFRTGQLQVTDGCQKLVKLLPTLIRDPKKPEDILKMDGDDPADSARYGIKSHLSPGKMPKADALAEKVKDLSPTSRAIWMRKAEEKSAVRVNPISGRRWRPGMRV